MSEFPRELIAARIVRLLARIQLNMTANQNDSTPSRSKHPAFSEAEARLSSSRAATTLPVAASPWHPSKPKTPEPSTPDRIRITCVDYCPEQAESREIVDLSQFLQDHRPSWSKVRWINISGSSRLELIEPFAEKYKLHPLAIEDVAYGAHRPKLEDYPGSEEAPGRLFIVARLVHMRDDRLRDEQVSIFLGRNTLLTFQETTNGVFESVYRRLETPGSWLRGNDVSFLCYSLLDAIVDSYFPVLEYYSARLDDIEEKLLHFPDQSFLRRIHAVKRGLLQLRRAIWPMREIIAQLQREKHECLSETTLTYFRDVYDHCVHIIDLNETYHEIATALTETYMSVTSNRLNEVVKVLTVISTIFIPLTFLAGVYGMNMPIPENQWSWTYPAFWLICLAIAFGMILWFRRRGWI